MPRAILWGGIIFLLMILYGFVWGAGADGGGGITKPKKKNDCRNCPTVSVADSQISALWIAQSAVEKFTAAMYAENSCELYMAN